MDPLAGWHLDLKALAGWALIWAAGASALGVILGRGIALADRRQKIREPVSTEELEREPSAMTGVVMPVREPRPPLW